ncbi:MAG: hypothetical protein US52_C0015G0008 [candidate division WS6 bacterium GW2011_GWA2_37_6]|uniref:Uncharacterized protein n=1 Tax=candidate division WS6 bacterium GW2011_GWA2_37_6 TaxID=1619087 RepID=A0A0G0JG78_9BACT|nr:MAG: hypothetical protein US52_C0015G0008 [candidate division WS6 bacterium GW2011_GWA2_37_6]
MANLADYDLLWLIMTETTPEVSFLYITVSDNFPFENRPVKLHA